MAFVTAETRKKVDQIVENMENYAVLADDRNPSAQVPGLDCTPGMGMPSDAENFRKLASDVNDGLFKILVMGKFKNGKSTFVNSIVSKSMMAAKATATTAVIATVSFGEDENNVDVFYTDPRKNTRMSLERFNEEFALTAEDQETIEGGGNCDRFADVDHVAMQSKDELFRDGVTLIDSPGLEEANSRTLTTYEYVPRANAIIFTLSAVSLFSAKEREYIMEHFAGKHLRNVFFVVNRIDNLNDGELEANVMPSVRKGLTSVFTNEAGEFDEYLYNRRVFFTNAYGALRLRTGKPAQTIVDGEVKSLTIEDTGILKFEAALRDFLSSDERINATFQSTLTGMANTYQRAKDKTASEKAARLLPLEELEKNAMIAEKKMQDALHEVENMRKAISSTAQLIAQKVYTDLITFARTNIPDEFEAELEGDSVQFGVKDMLRLAMSTLTGGDQSKIVQPLVEKIESYISTQLENWAKRVPTITMNDVEALKTDLNASLDGFSLNLEDAVQQFSGGYQVDEHVGDDKGTGTKLAQGALSIVFGIDPSLLVDVAAGGMAWGEFIKKFCTQFVVQSIVVALAGPLALPAIIATEFIQIRSSGQRNGQKILSQIGEKSFNEVANQIQEQEMDLKSRIETQIAEQCETMLTAAKNLVEDTRASQKRIVEEHSKGAEYTAAENARQDKVLDAMLSCVGNVYELMYGSRPSESEVAKIAVSTKEKSA